MTINPPKFIYWKDAKPEDFINIKQEDWIEDVGHVSTRYEVEFIERFGIALKNHSSAKESSDKLDEFKKWVENKGIAGWGYVLDLIDEYKELRTKEREG